MTDKRAITSPLNGKRGGRKKQADTMTKAVHVKLSDVVKEFVDERGGPAYIRELLEKERGK